MASVIGDLFEDKRSSLKNDGASGRWWSPVNQHILPAIGEIAVADLTTHMIVKEFGDVYRNKKATGDKVFRILRETLEFAKADDPRVDPNVLKNAKVRLGRTKTHKKERDENHQPALDWRMAPKLFASLPNGLVGSSLAFYMLTLPRVSNVLQMTWGQIDLAAKVWQIPAENIKIGEPFEAPLCPNAMSVLSRARKLGQDGSDLVFPNPKARSNPPHLHINAFRNFLRDNEWPSTIPGRFATAHGLRATFRTWCAEHDVPREIAEMFIQHETMGKVERAYNRTTLLSKRRNVLTKWGAFWLAA